MNERRPLFSLLCHPPVVGRPAVAFVALLVLVLNSPVFCGEIHDAAERGDAGKVEKLLKDNPDLAFSKDDSGDTPLHWAALNGHKDVTDLLLAHKAPVDARNNAGDTPLHWAALNGHRDIV